MNEAALLRARKGVAIALLCSASLLAEAAAPTPANPGGETLSAEFPYESRFIEVLGSRMHYVDVGSGEVVMLIHGNPTSSYLWRNVIPHIAKHYRVIAVDLIGMGRSDKPDIAYTYLDHRRYVDGFIEALGLKDITFVLHDWGTVLGTDYAMRHPANVRGIALMEALLPPAFPARAAPPPQSLFGRLRSPEGERLVYEENAFVERLIPGAVMRTLSEAEMIAYREPYRDPPSRKPTLMWPRELPMGGEPAVNAEIISRIGEWLKATPLPVLFFWIRGEEATADYYVRNLRNVETHYLGAGRHYVQEDHPESIGRAVEDWRRRVRNPTSTQASSGSLRR